MEYVWAALVSLAVALIGNRFLAGSGYSLIVDAGLALGGGVGAAYLFGMTTIGGEAGQTGILIFAVIGAGLVLLARRTSSIA